MGESRFTGGALGLWGIKLLAIPVLFLGVFTLGILWAWYSCFVQRWKTKHTFINGVQLRFDGRAIALWVRIIIWSLLTFITFGLYAFLGFRTIAKMRWFARHTHVITAPR